MPDDKAQEDNPGWEMKGNADGVKVARDQVWYGQDPGGRGMSH